MEKTVSLSPKSPSIWPQMPRSISTWPIVRGQAGRQAFCKGILCEIWSPCLGGRSGDRAFRSESGRAHRGRPGTNVEALYCSTTKPNWPPARRRSTPPRPIQPPAMPRPRNPGTTSQVQARACRAPRIGASRRGNQAGAETWIEGGNQASGQKTSRRKARQEARKENNR